VPVGFGRDGQPVFVNFEFVDGTRGAHVSISGVSGIATKTSFAMFLLHSITNCGVLAGEAHNTKVPQFTWRPVPHRGSLIHVRPAGPKQSPCQLHINHERTWVYIQGRLVRDTHLGDAGLAEADQRIFLEYVDQAD
jgi:hypothetical protein